MANRYAVATGNWSDPTIWDGGTLPTAGDVVRPNGFTVTIDVDVTVDELTNDASAPAVAHGTFTVTDNVTLNTNLTSRNTIVTPLMTINNAAGTVVINGDVLGNIANHANVGGSLDGIVIIGGLNGGCIFNGSVTSINGSAGGSPGGNTKSVVHCTGGVSGYLVTFNGIVNGTTNAGSFPAICNTIRVNSGYNVTFNGIVNPSAFFTNNSNQLVNFRTVVTDGSNNIINVTGAAFGNALCLMNTFLIKTGGSDVRLTGTAKSNVGRVFNIEGSSTITLLTGAIVDDSDGIGSIASINTIRCAIGQGVRWELIDSTLYTAGLLTGYPLEAKVEDGTVFGPSSEFTGTLLPWSPAFAQALANAQRDLQLPQILSAITQP